MSNLKNFPFVEFTVRAYSTSPDKNDGKGVMTFETFVTEVTDNDKNKMGSIGGGPGYVIIQVGEFYMLVPHDQMWTAAYKAIVEEGNWKKENNESENVGQDSA